MSLDASFVVVPREEKDSFDDDYSGATGPYAHDWRHSTTGGLRISGRHFVDKDGRVCWLRGVNLSGSCKAPVENSASTLVNGHEYVSFVGRPFPLDEAHEHLARLRRWGLTFIRLLVTWEAVEHEGPGKYDTAYLKYLQDLLSMFPKYGLVAFIAMHQDVWSRYTGGSGAPAWTLEVAGFNLGNLEDTGAAWVKGVRDAELTPNERGLWPTNYTKLAPATMATLFWAGETFAPKLSVEGINIQTYLQDKFLGAWEELAKAVGHLDAVVGFEMMNEPHFGYISQPSMHGFDYNTHLHLGSMPSTIQSYALGAGYSLKIPQWTRTYPWPSKLTHHEALNKEGKSVWRSDGPSGGKCVWEMHGVWGWDNRKQEPVVLRDSYFIKHPLTGKQIDWYTDYYFPFIQRWSSVVQNASREDKIIFTEAIPNEFCPSSWTPELQPTNMVFAPHWYDLIGLFRKEFGNLSINVQSVTKGEFILRAFHWGHRGARKNFTQQIGNIVEGGYKALGDTPVIIGECGVPMDLNSQEAFRTGDWSWQARMMDALITGLEGSLVGFTLWNYNPLNNNQFGDFWNGENFSFFSRSRNWSPEDKTNVLQSNKTLDEGGRILRAVVRPYPAKTAGIPTRFEYEMNTGKFGFEWMSLATQSSSSDTEIFMPEMLTRGRKVIVDGLDDGDTYELFEGSQTLRLTVKGASQRRVHRVIVSLVPPLRPMFVVNDFFTDFGRSISVIACIAIAALVIRLSF